jgi:hypothetical protein
MARKLRLTPLEGAIVAMLEEAGCEDVLLVIRTLAADAATEEDEQGELLARFEVAVRSLVARGLVTLVWSGLRGCPSVGDASRELLALTSWLRWDDARGTWTEPQRANGPVGLALPAVPR